MVRKSIPNVDWSEISSEGNQMIFEGNPVFLADYNYRPSVAGPHSLGSYFGNYGGGFVDSRHVSNENGDI